MDDSIITTLVHLLVVEGIAKIWLHEVSIFSVNEFGASGLPLSWRPLLGSSHSSENTAIGIELFVAHLSAR